MSALINSNSVNPNAQFNQEIGQLYIHHYHWLFSRLYKKLSCPHKAADLAQDTFSRILTARHQLYLSEAKSLLTTISKGLLVDYYRRQTIENAYLSALTHLPESQSPSAEERAIILETLLEIDRMLEGLHSKARQIFLLSQLDGLTYPQIAAQLNISLSSVQKHMTQTYLACYKVRFNQACL